MHMTTYVSVEEFNQALAAGEQYQRENALLKERAVELVAQLRKAQTEEANAAFQAHDLLEILEEIGEMLECDVTGNVYLDPSDLSEKAWNALHAVGCPAINEALERSSARRRERAILDGVRGGTMPVGVIHIDAEKRK